MEKVQDLIQDLLRTWIMKSSPVAWTDDRVATYKSDDGELEFVVTYTDDFDIQTICYNGKTIQFI